MNRHNTRIFSSPYVGLDTRTVRDMGTMTADQFSAYCNMSDELREAGTIGHEPTLANYLKNRQQVTIRPTEMPQVAYGITGDFVDVGRYMSGEPECMVDYFAQTESVKLCEVTVRVCRPGACSDGQVDTYYGMVLDTIDKLETSGTRCKVVIEFQQYYDKKGREKIMKLTIPFKNYDEPLNMSRFAGMVLYNRYQTALYILSPLWGHACAVDMYADYQLKQAPDKITFPSLYYKKYYALTPDEMRQDDFLRDMDLEYLIA